MSKTINEILLRSGTRERQDYLNEMQESEEYPCNLCGKAFKSHEEYDKHKSGENKKKKFYCKGLKEESYEEFDEELYESASGYFVRYMEKVVSKLEAKDSLTDKEQKILNAVKKGLKTWKGIKNEADKKRLEKKLYKQVATMGILVKKSRKLDASDTPFNRKQKKMKDAFNKAKDYYECQNCGKKFKDISKYKKHMKSHLE